MLLAGLWHVSGRERGQGITGSLKARSIAVRPLCSAASRRLEVHTCIVERRDWLEHDRVRADGARGREVLAGQEQHIGARRLGRDQPVAFVAFDLLWLDGHALTDRPWRERRERLDELALEGPSWTTPSAYEGDPAPLLEAGEPWS